jgi:hypothetical protein
MNLLQSLTAYTVNTRPAQPDTCLRSAGYPIFIQKFPCHDYQSDFVGLKWESLIQYY